MFQAGRFTVKHSTKRARWIGSRLFSSSVKASAGSDTLSSTVTQGVIEKNAPQDPNEAKPVPMPTHPNRNMEVPAAVPNEHTEARLPPQVPEMPGGGKYPDPLNQKMSEKMAPGPVNTKVHGTRPEADLLGPDHEKTMKD